MRAKPISRGKQYQLILECHQSGISDYSWYLEHDIKPGTFYDWVKRLRQTELSIFSACLPSIDLC